MKHFLAGALAVVLLGVVLRLLGCGAADESVAQALRADLAEREIRIATLTDSIAALDSTYTDSTARLEVDRLVAEETARVESARAATLAGQLRPALPDTLRPVLDSLTASYETALTNKDRIIAGYEAQVVLLDQRVAARDTLIGELRGALDVSKQESAEWERLYRKKDLSLFGLRLEVTCGPGVGAGFGTGGSGVYAGVGCVVGR